jgi:hypothetical protein
MYSRIERRILNIVACMIGIEYQSFKKLKEIDAPDSESFRKNKREKNLKKGEIKLPQSHSLDIWGNRTSSWIDDAIYRALYCISVYAVDFGGNGDPWTADGNLEGFCGNDHRCDCDGERVARGLSRLCASS